MKYTIIIPTMWKANQYLIPMLEQYEDCEQVGEVLIINNDKGFDIRKLSEFTKLRFLNDGNNLYVNPSWNLGVVEARFENIVLINDDIHVDDVKRVFVRLNTILNENIVVGFGSNCFAQRRYEKLGEMRITKANTVQQYGFGVFIAFLKKSYIPIPKELLVWYGDTFLYNILTPYIIDGVDVRTNMRTTSSTLHLEGVNRIEREIFNKLEL